MKNAFIIHGAYGSPQENWFPWLKGELEKLGYKVIVPQFPTPEGQSFRSWLEVFEPYKSKLNSDTIIIGHSIAVAFILRVLEQIDHPIKAAFLVAGFVRGLNNDEVDQINESFYDRPFDWEKIRSNCQEFVCFSSDNDPYVPIEQGEEVAENLGVEVTLVKDAGHFNTSSGYTSFPLILESISDNSQLAVGFKDL